MSIYEPIQNVYGNVETPLIQYYTLTFPKNSRERPKRKEKKKTGGKKWKNKAMRARQWERIQGFETRRRCADKGTVVQPTTRFWVPASFQQVQCTTCVNTTQILKQVFFFFFLFFLFYSFLQCTKYWGSVTENMYYIHMQRCRRNWILKRNVFG